MVVASDEALTEEEREAEWWEPPMRVEMVECRECRERVSLLVEEEAVAVLEVVEVLACVEAVPEREKPKPSGAVGAEGEGSEGDVVVGAVSSLSRSRLACFELRVGWSERPICVVVVVGLALWSSTFGWC